MRKTAKIAVFLILWFGLGLFNFGTINAAWAHEERTEFQCLHRTMRDELGFMIGESFLIPPVELLTSALLSNFWQYGWDCTDKPWR